MLDEAEVIAAPPLPPQPPLFPTWSAETRCAPWRHYRDARVYGSKTTVMLDVTVTPHMLMVVRAHGVHCSRISCRFSSVLLARAFALSGTEEDPG